MASENSFAKSSNTSTFKSRRIFEDNKDHNMSVVSRG